MTPLSVPATTAPFRMPFSSKVSIPCIAMVSYESVNSHTSADAVPMMTSITLSIPIRVKYLIVPPQRKKMK
ncbi:MAG: hypothetical protein A4E38_01017 [Methanoregulaceae archaeon PtaB.Bin108]|nr:MAG: hypothetical protein A4E38_01017 [Methanoregulaceae archaeon PtaB.Bin108]